MSESTPLVEAVRRAVSGSSRTERRGLAVLAILGAAVSLFVLGLSVGQLIGGDVAGAAAGAPALMPLGVVVVAARSLVGTPGGGTGTSASSVLGARLEGTSRRRPKSDLLPEGR
ncbi:hypothetical protein PU560_13060 [Georgenia sp. 10Sc9-8]|uniref:Uncharacterized protein n=1 Tax=Georgenia halotolerans TaxID=3028317 RepID=A0ABT5U0D5_9MICO|nr:hypothetical protein [Georgenia halotolerans]